MLRIATIEDVDELVRMSMQFLSTVEYGKYSDEVSVRDLIINTINSDFKYAVVFIHEGKGMIAGAVAPFFFGSHTVATEIGWWVEPEYRKEGIGKDLLEVFEYWAKQVGCKLITMVSLDDTLGKFYEKKGYVLRERTYSKEL